MANGGRVVVSTELDNSGIQSGMNGLERSLKKIGGLVAVVFGARALVSFGKQAVDLGSKVSEVQNVVDVAFGSMAYKCEEFAATSITQFGMSSLAAKETASNYMAMGKSMGLSAQEASDMAISVAKLTGDVASFYNGSQDLAKIRLRGIWTGETEALKELGVVMTEINLKEYALANGITKSYDAMTQAERVSLRYAYVMAALGDAQGDFVRTQDSWANQTRILSMQWQEFMSIIGQTLITVLAPAIKFLNTVVSALISAANAMNAAISSIFGGTNKQMKSTAGSAEAMSGAIGSGVDNQKALTKEAKKTGKEQSKTLASFDQINKLSDSSSAGGGSGGGAGAGGGVGGVATSPVEVVSSEEMDGSANKITKFFEELLRAIEPTKVALARLWEQLKLVGGFAGDALVDFYERFLKPVGAWVLGEGLPRFIDAITNGLASINWGRINGALKTLWDALAPFAINIGEGLLFFWENVLVPLGSWTMSNVVPLFLEILAAAIGILNGVIEALAPTAVWLFDNFLKPIASWTGGVIVTVLAGLRDALRGISDWVSQHGEAVRVIIVGISAAFLAWEAIKFLNYVAYIGALTNTAGWAALLRAIQQIAFIGLAPLKEKLIVAVGVVKGLASSFVSTVKHAAEVTIALAKQAAAIAVAIGGWIAGKIKVVALAIAQAAQTAASWAGAAATTALSTAIAFLTSTITLVVAAIGAIIAVIVLLVKHWDEVKVAAETCWTKIKEVWQVVATWFSTTVVEPVKGFFSGLWTGLKTGAETAWTDIKNTFNGVATWLDEHVIAPVTKGFKGFMNGLIGFAEGFVNYFIRGINKIVDGINSLSFDLPDILGGGHVGFNVSYVPELKLPRLARGAVIPANREFMAVLGDQRNGRNLEAPEGLIRQIMREEMSGMSGQGVVGIEFTGSLAQLGRMLKPVLDKESQRKGVKLVRGTV